MPEVADQILEATLEAPVRPVLNLIAEDLVIDKPVATLGGDVLIACATLKFIGDGIIDTGFKDVAQVGAIGQAGGNITIIAGRIESLKLRTTGQTGGVGYTGAAGARGAPGAAGARGASAHCQGGTNGPTKARVGEKGGTGGTGAPGGTGWSGGQGGASGNVSIRYVDSAVELVTVPPGVVLGGGAGGAGGRGGPGGPGGQGGPGGGGGDGVTCSVRQGSIKYGDVVDVSEPGAGSGPQGDWGSDGSQGVDGMQGAKGKPGTWLAERFANDQAYYDLIVGYLPTLVGGQLRKAELLLMLNRRGEAEALLKEIARTARKPVLDRAKLLLDRLDPVAARNFWNKPVFWAPVLLKEIDQGRQVMRTQADLRNDLDYLTRLLGEATRIAEYRAGLVYNAEQAVRAYEFEKRQLEDRIQDIRNRIDRAPAELAALVERLRSLEAQALALKGRIEKLVQLLASLPTQVVQKGRSLLDSVTSMVTNIGAAVTAAIAENWPLAVSFALNGLADLQRGMGTVQDLLNLRLDVENQIELTKQELARVGMQIGDANQEIRQLVSRQAEDAMAQDSLAQTQGLLISYQLNQDLPGLRRLRAVSEEALWMMRMTVAEQLHAIRRFIDLRLGRADAVQPMMPPGGLTEAFSYSHLLAILAQIQGAIVQAPPTNVVDWDMAVSGEAFHDEFARLAEGQLTNFSVTGAPDFLAGSRLRNVRVVLRDSQARDVGGYFDLSQCGGTQTTSKAAAFEFDKANWIFRARPGEAAITDERFAYRSLASTWSVKALGVNTASPRIASIEFQFQVELELAAAPLDTADAPAEAMEVLPAEWQTGSEAWLAGQLERVATLMEVLESVRGTQKPDGPEPLVELPVIQAVLEPT